MFKRFTDRAQRVVVYAQEEARLLNHNYIGTEHILLGLLHEGEGVGARALAALGISLEAVRDNVEDLIGAGQVEPQGHIPFTPRAKKVLELSLREAMQLGHDHINTEHILLGLLREGSGVGSQVLVRLGSELSRVRREVINLLSGYEGGPEEIPVEESAAAETVVRGGLIEAADFPVCPRCASPLSKSARYRTFELTDEDDESPFIVSFVYCIDCGVSLGVVGE